MPKGKRENKQETNGNKTKPYDVGGALGLTGMRSKNIMKKKTKTRRKWKGDGSVGGGWNCKRFIEREKLKERLSP